MLHKCININKHVKKDAKKYIGFNILKHQWNEYNNEWENLQSKLEKHTKIHEIDGWENLYQNNTIIFANDPHPKTLNANANEIEQYDLAYENDSCIKIPPKNIKTSICSSSQQINECKNMNNFIQTWKNKIMNNELL